LYVFLLLLVASIAKPQVGLASAFRVSFLRSSRLGAARGQSQKVLAVLTTWSCSLRNGKKLVQKIGAMKSKRCKKK
jgi:hypothetical protein